MDPFQQRMMGMQQDPMRHQVTLEFSLVPLLCYVSYLLLFSLMQKKGSSVPISEEWVWLSLLTFTRNIFLFSVLVRL